MNWTDWFRRGSSPDEVRPSLRDVTFETEGARVGLKRTSDSVEWRHSNDDRVVGSIVRATERPLWPWTLEALRTFARDSAASRSGGIVSATFDHANGVPIAVIISKFPDGSGYAYEGTLIIRFRDAQYGVTIHADEGRSTGAREATLTGLLLQLGELRLPVVVPPAKSAALEGWFRDPYDPHYAGPTLHSLADDERVDVLVPQHPLSRVRHWLAEVRQTLAVAPDLLSDIVEPESPAPSSHDTPHRMSPLAVAILSMHAGRPDLAEQYLWAGIPMRDGAPILDAPRAGEMLILLGTTREVLGRDEDAAWAHGWAVEAFRATTGERSPGTIRARANLGRVYAGLQRPSDAEPLLVEAIPEFERAGNDAELAVALNAMGLVRQSQGRHAEALPHFERALAIFEKLHGPDHPECATVRRNMARPATPPLRERARRNGP